MVEEVGSWLGILETNKQRKCKGGPKGTNSGLFIAKEDLSLPLKTFGPHSLYVGRNTHVGGEVNGAIKLAHGKVLV